MLEMSKYSGIALFLPLFWVMSPEALVLIGNNAGQSGELFLFAIGAGLIVSLATVSLHQHPSLPAKQTDLFFNTLDTLGPLLTITFTLASCLSLVLLLPTGVLVSAGFTFNETFVYWFPNFGFSFLLLFLILLLHLAGQQYVLIAQRLFLLICLFSLLLIIFYGLTNTPSDPPVSSAESLDVSTVFSSTGIALMLFLGHHSHVSSIKRSTQYLSLIFSAILIFSWAGVSLKYVDPVKLSESSIPYLLTSREVLDQTGRVIVGIAVISGACALVNNIILMASNTLINITEQWVALNTTKTQFLKKFYPVLFTTFIATSLAGGLAGSQYIDTYIYSALLLWMLLIGLNNLAVTLQMQRIIKSRVFHYLLISLIYPAAALYLAIVHHQNQRLALLCFVILSVSLLFSFCCNILSRKSSLTKTKTSYP